MIAAMDSSSPPPAPLSDSHDASLNASAQPPTTADSFDAKSSLSVSTTTTTTTAHTAESLPTSAANTVDGDSDVGDETSYHNAQSKLDCSVGANPSSSINNRHSRVMSGNELSPLMLATAGQASSSEGGATARSPPTRRGMFGPNRFPVKVRSPSDPASPNTSSSSLSRPASVPNAQAVHAHDMSIDEAIQSNSSLAKAIDIFEDDEDEDDDHDDGDASMDGSESGSVIVRGRGQIAGSKRQADDDQHVTVRVSSTRSAHPSLRAGARGDHQHTHSGHRYEADNDDADVDDSMMSTFSTFSAVPNLAVFGREGGSPAKSGNLTRARTEPHDGMASPNLLMEFTDNLRHPSKSPSRRHNQSPSRGPLATPQRQSATNLLDFDIPPLPTPRSIPSITPRELESLKSNFLSEISSLKASLSGKEAEVASLKTAVGDAEKRVGECMEQVREERAGREVVAAEKESWERRGREMDSVLRKVRDDMMHAQREREELESKLEESEKRREAAEMMAQDAESKMAGLRAGKVAAESREAALGSNKSPTAASTTREVEQAVERVARELHALYKGKHETKVAALKKSYETRWEKRVRDLEARLDELTEENDGLRAGLDTTMARMGPDEAAEEERRVAAARDAAQIRELVADVDRLEAIARTVQRDNDDLRRLLEQERVEKGELVQLAEEMMAMQQTFVAPSLGPERRQPPSEGGQSRGPPAPAVRAQSPQQPPPSAPAAASPRKSMPPPPSRTPGKMAAPRPASGLRAPGSRIGGGGGVSGLGSSVHGRTNSGGGALPRLGGAGMRSSIMGNIEKMGNYRGRE